MVRVLVASARAVRGAGLAALLAAPHRQVYSAPARDLMRVAADCPPDVAVLDLDDHRPGEALPLVRELRARFPHCRVLLVSALDRPGLLQEAVAADPDGVLPTDATAAALGDTVQQLAAGHAVDWDAELVAAAQRRTTGCPLSTREADVLSEAGEGASAAEIATRLCLSHGTVRNYLSRGVRKLGARTRLDALRIARTHGWL